MDMGLHGAMLAGFAGGLVSCVGYSKLMPLLVKINVHDTCGVNNLHGMPGILGAVVGIIVTAMMDNDDAAHEGRRGFQDEDGKWIGADKQTFALLITVGLALAIGTLAGILMSLPLKAIGVYVPDAELFRDGLYFGETEDYLDAVDALVQAKDIDAKPAASPVCNGENFQEAV